ncbi:MAG: SLBB domain-containing protein [Chitinophagaceae bacterium]
MLKSKVHLSGEVNREGFYEIQPNETLENAIDFAGGYTSNAFKARITGVTKY